MTDFRRKCPHCPGDLVRSKTHAHGYTYYFWKKPWRTGLLDWGAEKLYPWACMGCGVVLFYLDRLPAVAEEYKSARERGRAASIEPAVLKS